MAKTQITKRSSAATKALQNAWERLRRLHPSIPSAVVILIDARGRTGKLGLFAHSSWRVKKARAHEVAISPLLFKDPKQVLSTLLHEAAHAMLWKKHRAGMSGRYYHNKTFRDACRNLGLACDFLHTRYGWTITSWPKGQVPQTYASVLTALRRELPQGAIGPQPISPPPRKPPASGLTRLQCRCSPPRTVLVAKRSLQGPIVCGQCKGEFKVRARRKSEWLEKTMAFRLGLIH